MDADTIDKYTIQSVYDHDGNEKTPLYAKNDNEKTVLKLIVGFCLVFCIGLLIILLAYIHYGSHQLEPHGNVASDSSQCSQYGIDILNMGGNAVDAAITSAFCNSVALPHLSGLGGSGVMMIYDHRTGIGNTIDFRATCSANCSIGVPGFMAGLFYAHVNYGILPWKTLIEPSINLAKFGITVTKSLFDAINQDTLNVQDENLKLWLKLVLNSTVGEVVKVPNGLINTLTLISSHGPIEFYNEMSQELKSILKTDEVIGYKPISLPVLKKRYMNYTIISSNKGTGGPILMDMLNMIHNIQEVSLLNSFKDLRKDDWYENSGLQVSTTDVFDIYVTIISGLGSIFGSRILTNSGYILNNVNQKINQTDRVSSLHSPFIAIETEKICGRRLISGSADVRDGAQLLLLMLNTNPESIHSVDTVPRIHFKNNDITIENSYKISEKNEELLINLGYNISKAPLPYPTFNIIQKVEDKCIAFSDSRGSGQSITI